MKFLINIFFRYNVLEEDDIQGEEDGVSGMDGNVQVNHKNNISFEVNKY